MRETLLLFIVLTEYCSSSCLFCPVLSSLSSFCSFRWWRHLAINGVTRYRWLDSAIIVFDLESSALVRQKLCHRLESVCPPLIWSQKYSLKLFKGLYMSNIMHFISNSRGGSLMMQQLSTWMFTRRSNLWRDALGTGTAHCFGCDHYALKCI